MKDRPGVMFYFENRGCLDALTDAEAGKLTKSIMRYAQTGEKPHFDGVLHIVWLMLQPTIDRDAMRYFKQCRQKSYAVYCREQDKQAKTKLSFDEWQLQDTVSADIGWYPTTTTTPTPTPTPTPTTTPTTTPAAATTVPQSADAPEAVHSTLLKKAGLKGLVRMEQEDYVELMDEMGLDRMCELLLTAETLAQKRGYQPEATNWKQLIRFLHKFKQEKP